MAKCRINGWRWFLRALNAIGVKELLSYNVLFSGLDERALSRVAQGTRLVEVHKGQNIFHQGDACDGLHVIAYGQIKLSFVSAHGAEKVVEVVNQGDCFGEASLFSESNYNVCAQALSESLLVHVTKSSIIEQLDQSALLCQKMLARLAGRKYQLLCDIEMFSLLSGKQRIAAFLLNEITLPDEDRVSVKVCLPAAKGVIASRLNLTQEHFSRILGDLVGQGLITLEGKLVTIINVGKLRHCLN